MTGPDLTQPLAEAIDAVVVADSHIFVTALQAQLPGDESVVDRATFELGVRMGFSSFAKRLWTAAGVLGQSDALSAVVIEAGRTAQAELL